MTSQDFNTFMSWVMSFWLWFTLGNLLERVAIWLDSPLPRRRVSR